LSLFPCSFFLYPFLVSRKKGWFNLYVPALDGCFTQGETEEEALQNAKGAILCHLEGLEKLNEIKSRPGIPLREIEVFFMSRT
jgi:predicted RNase H-like HicB family nuclease